MTDQPDFHPVNSPTRKGLVGRFDAVKAAYHTKSRKAQASIDRYIEAQYADPMPEQMVRAFTLGIAVMFIIVGVLGFWVAWDVLLDAEQLMGLSETYAERKIPESDLTQPLTVVSAMMTELWNSGVVGIRMILMITDVLDFPMLVGLSSMLIVGGVIGLIMETVHYLAPGDDS